MHQPTRTCVGCRTRRAQADLLRLRRRADGRIMPAHTVSGGRSVYLCPQRACYDRAQKRSALTRGLQRAGRCHYDAVELWNDLQSSRKGGE